MESLDGKVAIVTGGTRGIGRAITERLLVAGASVAICGRRQDAIDSAIRDLAGRGKVFGVAADIRRVDDVRTLFASVDREFGGLGQGFHTPLPEHGRGVQPGTRNGTRQSPQGQERVKRPLGGVAGRTRLVRWHPHAVNGPSP